MSREVFWDKFCWYITAVVYSDREYNNVEELLCASFLQPFDKTAYILSVWDYVNFILSCSAKCGSITGNSRKENLRVVVF